MAAVVVVAAAVAAAAVAADDIDSSALIVPVCGRGELELGSIDSAVDRARAMIAVRCDYRRIHAG
jgi:hypothetical protein